GIFAAVMLGLGRALGETIAVTMVIGNSPKIAASIFSPGYTMASLIANEFSEATGPSHLEALIAVGLLLFAVTLLINAGARLVIRKGLMS
ncbi:MAG TPA: phosphate ABC transporter permease subunit PstC, partial [Actinomycetota bacterium]|nr:phosphate ABC transporter permease subunit PstC [Actinomycetota bacterium]